MKAIENPSREGSIKSVVVGARLLQAIASGTGPQTLTQLADEAAMPTAKARRYLLGYMQAGLVTQDPGSHLYDLGPSALRLGLSAIARFDVVKRADPVLRRLSLNVGQTVGLMVWCPSGPMLARLVVSNHPIALTMRVGSVMPVLDSASGRVFASQMEAGYWRSLVEREKKEYPRLESFDEVRILTRARKQGYVRVDGTVQRGVTAFAVPVFGALEEPVAALIALGLSPSFSATAARAVVDALLQASTQINGTDDVKELPKR